MTGSRDSKQAAPRQAPVCGSPRRFLLTKYVCPGTAGARLIMLAALSCFLPGLLGLPLQAAPQESQQVIPETAAAGARKASGKIQEKQKDPDPAGQQSQSTPAQGQQSPGQFHLGGALRFNYFVKSWDQANRDKYGEFAFDTFRVNADGSYEAIDVSLEYRFYAGYNMLHHGFFGYTFSQESGRETQLQVGVMKKPFGLLPYASHNWFFDVTYYLGMEDDYDLGVKILLPRNKLDLQLAFFKTDEGHYTGDSIDSARYSYDVVRTDETELGGLGIDGPRTNEEVNQFNGRLAYTFGEDSRSAEIGLSGEYGGLYNRTTRKTGNHWATAIHFNGNYNRFNVMLETIRYGFRPENPTGQDDRFIVMGAYDAPYKVAARGAVYVANVAYTLPISVKWLDSIMFYSNYSYLGKNEPGFADSKQYVPGMLFTTGGLLTYVDFAMGKNHPWIGPNYGFALAEGDPAAPWELRFNINIGYYF